MKRKYDDKKHKTDRERLHRYYHSGKGKKYNKLYYLMKVNNITNEEMEGLETIDEKLEYCQIVHIRNKYGITVKDFDDATTVCSEVPLVENI